MVLNYTTTVAVDKTIGEITKLLAGKVASISTLYDREGVANGLAFALRTPHGERSFRLEVDVAGIHALLKNDPGAQRRGRAFLSRAQAERVAWRVWKDWLAAQLTLVEAELIGLDQVMLPFLEVAPNETLYDRYVASEQRALDA